MLDGTDHTRHLRVPNWYLVRRFVAVGNIVRGYWKTRKGSNASLTLCNSVLIGI